MKELLLGCGAQTAKLIATDGRHEWHDLTRLDINPAHNPDVVWDLNELPLPFEDESFDEISAYDTLEHVGQQGDWRFFFAQFDDFWRILKPGGKVLAICPTATSRWAWGDPGHTRIVSPESLIFLHRPNYGTPPMTDYRPWFVSDWDVLWQQITNEGESHAFVLQAVKPARPDAPLQR